MVKEGGYLRRWYELQNVNRGVIDSKYSWT